MKKRFLFTLLVGYFMYVSSGNVMSQSIFETSFNLSQFNPKTSEKSDNTPAFLMLFDTTLKVGGGTATIPSGEYYLSGLGSIKIPSNTIPP
ncbi:hypothetical protein [Runella sp.]|uniref:hypothetical protein n=1 Tax=Runella sp. TaxID=1960881 RepID=UPI002638FF92|nr:hypothetical protein [Runella sp.]